MLVLVYCGLHQILRRSDSALQRRLHKYEAHYGGVIWLDEKESNMDHD